MATQMAGGKPRFGAIRKFADGGVVKEPPPTSLRGLFNSARQAISNAMAPETPEQGRARRAAEYEAMKAKYGQQPAQPAPQPSVQPNVNAGLDGMGGNSVDKRLKDAGAYADGGIVKPLGAYRRGGQVKKKSSFADKSEVMQQPAVAMPSDGDGDEGAKLQGPGTATSDSIDAQIQETGEPIRVANGERILSVDQDRYLSEVAKRMGHPSVDAMLEEGTGKPVGPTIKYVPQKTPKASGARRRAANGMAPENYNPLMQGPNAAINEMQRVGNIPKSMYEMQSELSDENYYRSHPNTGNEGGAADNYSLGKMGLSLEARQQLQSKVNADNEREQQMQHQMGVAKSLQETPTFACGGKIKRFAWGGAVRGYSGGGYFDPNEGTQQLPITQTATIPAPQTTEQFRLNQIADQQKAQAKQYWDNADVGAGQRAIDAREAVLNITSPSLPKKPTTTPAPVSATYPDESQRAPAANAPAPAAAGALRKTTDLGNGIVRVDEPGRSPLFTNLEGGADNPSNIALMNRGQGKTPEQVAQNQLALDNMQARQDARDQAALNNRQYASEVASAQAFNEAQSRIADKIHRQYNDKQQRDAAETTLASRFHTNPEQKQAALRTIDSLNVAKREAAARADREAIFEETNRILGRQYADQVAERQARGALDRTRLGMDQTRLAMDQAREGRAAQDYARQQAHLQAIEALHKQLSAETDQTRRAQLMDTIQSMSGKEPNPVYKTHVIPATKNADGSTTEGGVYVENTRTGQGSWVGQNPNHASLPPGLVVGAATKQADGVYQASGRSVTIKDGKVTEIK